MRWEDPLDEILGSRAKVRILRCLWLADGEALSGREIARRTGLSHTAVSNALVDLDAQQVAWPSADPTGTRYRLNRTNELVRQGLAPLFGLEASTASRIAAEIVETIPDALSVILFGSVARGEQTPDSDLDVLIVVPDDVDPEEAVDRIDGVDYFARFGRLLSPVVYTRATIRREARKGIPLVRNVLAEGVLLHGTPLAVLIGAERAAG